MPKTIISDTSCFIVLSKVSNLDILQKLHGTIMTTPEIVSEFGEPLLLWVEVESYALKAAKE